MEGGLIVREYRPSEDEFNNPKTLLESIISECQNVGLAKVCFSSGTLISNMIYKLNKTKLLSTYCLFN